MAFALHDAARSGDITKLTAVIGQGANLDQIDKVGWSRECLPGTLPHSFARTSTAQLREL